MKNLLQPLILFLFCWVNYSIFAQVPPPTPPTPPSEVKGAIKQEMEEKYAEPAAEKAHEKGRDALKEITYGDKGAIVPLNLRTTGTLIIQHISYKKNGKVSGTQTIIAETGKKGESIDMQDQEDRSTRLLYLYDENAHYAIHEDMGMAMKMPFKHISKFIQKASFKIFGDRFSEMGNNGTWIATDNIETINGYQCREYIYTSEDEKSITHTWMTQQKVYTSPFTLHTLSVIPDITEAAQKNALKSSPFPEGSTLIKAVLFDKGKLSAEYEIKSYKATSNERSFSIQGYRVSDLLDKL